MTKPRHFSFAIVLFFSFWLPVAIAQTTITVQDAWARATPTGVKVGGGYMTILNGGNQPDVLLSVESAVAQKTEIHKSENIGGVASMRWMEDGVKIPASGEIKFAPGGLHLMFVGLKQSITQGDLIPVTLKFEQAGNIEVLLLAGRIGSLKAPDAIRVNKSVK